MIKKVLAVLLSITIAVAAWNWPVTYRIGVDGRLFEKRIPLYAKVCGFLYRDWMYKDLVREICVGEHDDIKKVLALMKWTHENIRLGVPDGLSLVDDHPLNIIIRQYGGGDQVEDVFTILCSYAGFKSVYERCFDRSRTKERILSFVKVGGRWLVLDASQNRHFLNKNGSMASAEECAKGDVAMTREETATYKDIFENMKEPYVEYTTRTEEQMPLQRTVIEAIKIFKRGTR